ncbi:MAG: hypothetical protein LCH56_17375 [Proteobacteria bacterium]|nr:hypothetical protein [Pseudomonadota bacterium]
MTGKDNVSGETSTAKTCAEDAGGGISWRRADHALLWLAALFFAGSTAVGMVRFYSPVPFWDMWGTYLYAYMAYLDGTWRNLFAQTNEHKVWLSNILFFLDIRFFGGRSLLLIPVNFLLAGAIWGILLVAAHGLLRERKTLVLYAAPLLVAPCFSWLQEQNFTWGYQTQFFLAYLVPLAAFMCLAAANVARRGTALFLGAVLLGVMSAGTMANGVLVLPLLVLVSLVMRNIKRAALLSVVAAATLLVWFDGYRFTAPHYPSVGDAALFLLTFLGHPFAVHFGPNAGAAAGGLFIAAALAHTTLWMRAPARPAMQTALLAMLAFIGLSGGLMALGRAAMDGAVLSSRYATPALMGWSILALLTLYALRDRAQALSVAIAAGVAVMVALAPAQWGAFGDAATATRHAKMTGALALKLGVEDPRAIGEIYPVDPDSLAFVMATAADADRRGLSIFADPDLGEAARRLGTRVDSSVTACMGAVDAIAPTRDRRYSNIQGWAFDRTSGKVPPFVLVADEDVIVGIAVTGARRPDVAERVDSRGLLGGFSGYLRAEAGPHALQLLCRHADRRSGDH